MSTPSFFLNLAIIIFFDTKWARNRRPEGRSSLLTFNSVNETIDRFYGAANWEKELCALKQVFWKHSIFIIQDYLQVFFEKASIHKSAAKAKIFPSLVVMSGVVLCREEPVHVLPWTPKLLSDSWNISFYVDHVFFWHVRCRERAKVAEYPATY